MKILLTGAAGFIGFYVSKALLDRGHEVRGLDNLNAYYDPALKEARLAQLRAHEGFSFQKADITDQETINRTFTTYEPQRVIHLAAQAGVRHSLTHPQDYIQSNLVGFFNVLETSYRNRIEHLIFASSSSVYGANTCSPFSVHDNTDHPLSLYGASKKANEAIAHCYAHLYDLPITGLRFFTVYGPWGRPDMALFMFVRNILSDKPIDVFNQGLHARDFTYIDDVVEGVVRIADRIPQRNRDWSSANPDPATSAAPYRLYNIGNNNPVQLMEFISCIEDAVGRKAKKKLLPLQPGDIPETCADISDLARDIGFKPSTPIKEGIERFVTWYREYYGV